MRKFSIGKPLAGRRLVKKGFTLIEILVAVTIIALVVVSSSQIFTFILRNTQKAKAIMTLKQTGDSALTIISDKLRTASNITSCPTPPTPSSTITLETNTGSSLTISCTTNSLTIGSDTLIDGTSDQLEIVSPANCFTCYQDTPSSPTLVQISFTLRKTTADVISQAELLFSTSVALRN